MERIKDVHGQQSTVHGKSIKRPLSFDFAQDKAAVRRPPLESKTVHDRQSMVKSKEGLKDLTDGKEGIMFNYQNNDVGLSEAKLASKIGYRSSNFVTIPAANKRTSILNGMIQGG